MYLVVFLLINVTERSMKRLTLKNESSLMSTIIELALENDSSSMSTNFQWELKDDTLENGIKDSMHRKMVLYFLFYI